MSVKVQRLRQFIFDGPVPGDKSISHRALMFAAMAKGKTQIKGFLAAEDPLSTLSCLQALGVQVRQQGTDVFLDSPGIRSWQDPGDVLNVGNSGTTIRLMMGILAGAGRYAVLSGDASIRRRPMLRVIEPLRQLGAQLHGREQDRFAPVTILPSVLVGAEIRLSIASAQVKSAVLLAGLQAKGTTTVIEPSLSRDHTERMLRGMGVLVAESFAGQEHIVSLVGGQELQMNTEMLVPGDLSSAAFLLVLASLLPNSEVTIRSVGLNPSRIGVVTALQEMGADIEILRAWDECGEPVGDLRVCSSELHGIEMAGEIIPRLIDEIPILCVAALFANGSTFIRDAQELRVKETDRIGVLATGLRAFGAVVEEFPDGLRIEGGHPLHGATVDSHGDHRLAMSYWILGLLLGDTMVLGEEAANVSFPNFGEVIVTATTI